MLVLLGIGGSLYEDWKDEVADGSIVAEKDPARTPQKKVGPDGRQN